MFSLICVWINGWVNTHEAGDLRRYRADYGVIVMVTKTLCINDTIQTYKTVVNVIVIVLNDSSLPSKSILIITTPLNLFSLKYISYKNTKLTYRNHPWQEGMVHFKFGTSIEFKCIV